MNAVAVFPVGRLTPAHASDYRTLMLEAYAREPDAFTATPEERAALAAARAMPGVRMATLTVSEGNRGAQALYERHGFRAFGTEPMAIREGERYIGKVHMTCDLEEIGDDGERRA